MLHFYTYKLPFSDPFLISGQKFTHRQGVIVQFKKNGITALGEAAPLPGFSTETYQDVLNQIIMVRKSINELLESLSSLNDLENFLNKNQLTPSLQFCLFTLCSSFLAQEKKQSLHRFLFDTCPNRLPVNAVIDLGKTKIQEQLKEYAGQGFNTIKIKADTNIDLLISQLQTIRSNHPDIQLRIDANQSWSLEQALHAFKKIALFNIEYCEEPLANPDKKSISILTGKSSVPVALDESLTKLFSLSEGAELADVLILKPMVLGHISTQQQANSNDDKTGRPKFIYTTSLEGAIGRLMTATLAAGLGSGNHAHGLATGNLLLNDFWSDQLFIHEGFFNLPDGDKLTKLMNSGLENMPLKKVQL